MRFFIGKFLGNGTYVDDLRTLAWCGLGWVGGTRVKVFSVVYDFRLTLGKKKLKFEHVEKYVILLSILLYTHHSPEKNQLPVMV